MKTIRGTSAVALAFALSIGLSACDFAGVSEAVDSFKVIIGLEKIATPVSVRFIDATTGELVSSGVELSFDGADGESVVDLFNDPIADGKGLYSGGVAAFGIANSITPSDDDPVDLRLTARVDGYAPQVMNVRLTDTGRQSSIIRLTPTGSAPEGGAAVRTEAGSADASGSISEEIQVSTAPAAGTQGTASVTVPAGTVARTASGTPLQGALTTSITYASTATRQALATFPGGSQAEVEGGGDGVLTTVGFANVTLQDARGNVAKTFTEPIEISLDIADGTINPLTGNPVAPGDVLEVYSFDVEDGIWKPEGTSTVASVDGRLRAMIRANHLSTWSLGGYIVPCLTYFNVQANGNAPSGIRVWNSFYSNTYPVWSMYDWSFPTMMVLPSRGTFQYQVTGATTVAGTFEACGSVNVTLPAPVQSAVVTIESSVEPCPEGQSLKAGYEGDYGLEVAEVVNGQADWESAQTVTVSVVTEGDEISGSASVAVRDGATYRVQGSFNEEEITGSFTAPAGVAAGDVISAEIDNQITDDVAADACE